MRSVPPCTLLYKYFSTTALFTYAFAVRHARAEHSCLGAVAGARRLATIKFRSTGGGKSGYERGTGGCREGALVLLGVREGAL